MNDVFISYSRKDSTFVRSLFERLAQEGKDVWVDWEDIPVSANWWAEICGGIENADTFLFVVSTSSTISPICNFEIEHALRNNKRIIPILHQDVNEFDIFEQLKQHRLTQGERDILGERDLLQVAQASWKAISHHNWLYFRDEASFDQSFEQLMDILSTDLEYVRIHTRLLVRARQWELEQRKSGLLLTSGETAEAELWQAQAVNKQPFPTPLHYEYILASRIKHRKNQRNLLIGVSAALGITIILSIVALLLYQQSQTNYQIAVTAQEQAIREADRAETQAAIAQNNAATAVVAQEQALIEADNAATQAAIAQNNEATAVVAQEQALIEADNAATQAAIAQNNAATAVVAQGQALVEADNAATQAAIAQNNAATAVVAQNDALIQAQTAVAAESTSFANANIAATQAAIAGAERDRAQSIALAAQSELELNGALPERSIILAAAALRDHGYSWQAERALGLAVAHTLSPQTIRQNNGQIRVLVAVPGRGLLFSADQAGNIVRIDLAAGTSRSFAAHRGAITSMTLSPDGTRLLVTSVDMQVSVWNLNGTERLRIPAQDKPVLGASWSPDSRHFLTFTAATAIIRDAATGEAVASLSHGSAVLTDAKWSPAGDLIATAAQDKTIRVWSAEGVFQRSYAQHTDIVRVIAFSPDGLWIASGGAVDAPAVHIWNPYTSQRRYELRGHMLPIARLVWSPDSRLLAVVDNNPDFRFTRTSSTARVWDMANGSAHFVVFSHTNFVYDASWSPDSQRLVTVGGEGSIFIWDAASGGEMLSFELNGAIHRALWMPDGEAIAVGGEEGVVRIFPIWANTEQLVARAEDCCVTRILTGEESRQFGLPTATSMPAPETLASCPAALESRLYPGVWGRVVTGGNSAPVNVRNLPQLNSTVIRQIPPDQGFYVLDGPECADDIAWFEVRFGLNATVGWIAEGQDRTYFVQPDQR